jgi:hypothetical protein
MKIKNILLAIIALFIGYILYDSFSQPNTSDLKGNFKEVSLYRNPNNTGPVVRVYAVSVEGTPWEEMQKYGDLMPYNKYGSTTVYFFPATTEVPKNLNPEAPHFDRQFEEKCLAVYTKDPNGQVSLSQYPFK